MLFNIEKLPSTCIYYLPHFSPSFTRHQCQWCKLLCYPTLHAYLLLPFSSLYMVNTPPYLGYIYPAYPTPLHPAHPILPKPIPHYYYTLILPYLAIMVEVNKQKKKTKLLSKSDRNDRGPKQPRPKRHMAEMIQRRP